MVCLLPADSLLESHFFAAIRVSLTTLLTIRAELGDILYASPVPGPRSREPDVLSLTEIQEASTVTIRETDGPLEQSVKVSSLADNYNTRVESTSQLLLMFLKEKLGGTSHSCD